MPTRLYTRVVLWLNLFLEYVQHTVGGYFERIYIVVIVNIQVRMQKFYM